MERVLLAVCGYLAWASPRFLTADNALNVLRSISMQGLIALGMTMVIIVGEIDLSVGAAAAFAGCLLAFLTERGVPICLGIPATLAVGAALGAFSGIVRVRFQVPSFISTLALYTALKGAALMVTNGFSLTPFPQWFAHLGSGFLVGLPFPAVVFLSGAAAVHVVMARTAFGRAVYASGGNAEAARLCGINVGRVRVAVMTAIGALSAMSGILLSARIMSGTAEVAQGWELEAIAAVIVGGASFSGGVGTIWGTLVGLVFIGVIVNGMTLLNVAPYTQYIAKGLLIFAAVLVNRARAATGK
jgi:ribose/xylose/arabinose/galactoside ABC-type transport system permease subunit